MGTWLRLTVLGLGVLMAMPAFAQDKTLEERLNDWQELQIRQDREKREREGVPPDVERPEYSGPRTVGEPGIGSLPEVGKERRATQQAPLSFGSTGSGRLVYAKPFVTAPKAIVGGYMDIQYPARARPVSK